MDTTKADELATRMVSRCMEADAAEWKSLVAEFTALDGDGRIRCWSMTAEETQRDGAPYTRAKEIHKHLAALILQVMGVPMGEAGVGVQPTGPVAERMLAEEKARTRR